MKQIDVVALGELLIDFTESGISAQGNLLFEANPGVLPVMCWRCSQNLGTGLLLSGKSEMISLVNN